MAQYTVVEAGTNKFGFGNVKVVGGEGLHEKGKYGFGTGEKKQPPCKAGDTIEADLGSNAKGYPEIKNITVTGSGTPPPQAQAGGIVVGKDKQFRSVPELNRVDAIKFAIANRNEPDSVVNIIDDAILIEAFIQDGEESEKYKRAVYEYVGAEGSGPKDTLAGEVGDDVPF
jgi:hypothetical protein